MTFGKIMRKMRNLKKMSIWDLEEKTTMSRQTLYAYERGDFQPKIDEALRISKILDFSLDALEITPEPVGKTIGQQGFQPSDQPPEDSSITKLSAGNVI